MEQSLHGNGDRLDTAAILHALGMASCKSGDFDQAKQHLKECLRMKRFLHGDRDHPHIAVLLHEIGRVSRDTGDLKQAKQQLEESLRMVRFLHGHGDHPNVAAILDDLCFVSLRAGDLMQAEQHLKECLRLKSSLHGDRNRPDIASVLHALGLVYRFAGDLDRAKQHLEESLQIQCSLHADRDHPDIAATVHALGQVVQALEDRRRHGYCSCMRKVARKKQQKLHVAATKVQRTWRGYKDRQYVTRLRIDQARFDRLMRSAIVIQSGVRMALARREHDRRKLIRWAGGASTIQRQARIFLQRKELHELALKDQPVQAMFTLNTNGMHRTVMPWTWRVFVAPWAGEEAPGEENGFVDIFNKVGVDNWQTIAVVNCQKMVRGFLSRIRTQRLKTIALCSVRSMVDGCLEEVTRRKAAAIKIQSIARGFLVRRKNLISQKRNAAWEANVDNIVAVQAFFRRYLAQEVVVTGVLNNTAYFAATMIQTAWRGWLARRHVERLREEALWPLKGWFEFTATGRDAVQVEVCFLANPSFNDYKYFLEYGSTSTLQLTLKELEKDLASAISAVQGNQFLKDDGSRRPSVSKDRSSKARAKPKSESRKEDGKQEQRSEEAPQEGDPKVDKKEAKSKARAAREAAKEEGRGAGETADPASPGAQSESGKKASKPPKDSEAQAEGQTASKPKAAAKGAAKAEPRKAEAGKKETSGGEAQPPKPDSAQLKPPTLGADASVREMSQSTQANELRKTASGTAAASPAAEQGAAAAAGVESLDLGSVKPKPAEKPPNPNQGKNYAGAIKNGKFEKKKVDSIEELSKDERAAIMADIEEEKQKKLQALQEKQKQQQKKKKQQEAKVQEAQRSQMEQAEAQEEERRKQKVQELKKWLKQKEEQDRAKKERDAVLLQELQEKEVQKQEQQKVLEQARQEQRDKRLQAVAKQKAKLEAQLLASREAAIQEKINASQRSETKLSGDAEVSQESMEGQPPEETDPRMRKQQLLIQQQLGNERMGYGPGMPGMPGMPQRIVHRHIHHHVHYHEGDGEEPALPSMEERRRIEQASEDRVKQKLAEQGMGEMEQGFGPHGVDPIAETPTMQQSRSLPALHSRSVQRTQEGPFRLLPDINAREIGAKHGVPNFGQSVDRAIQSYANSGRPRFVVIALVAGYIPLLPLPPTAQRISTFHLAKVRPTKAISRKVFGHGDYRARGARKHHRSAGVSWHRLNKLQKEMVGNVSLQQKHVTNEGFLRDES
eukprot:s2266_g4.t1